MFDAIERDVRIGSPTRIVPLTRVRPRVIPVWDRRCSRSSIWRGLTPSRPAFYTALTQRIRVFRLGGLPFDVKRLRELEAEHATLKRMYADLALEQGIVKLKLTAVFDAQHGGFTTGWSPVSWGSIDELFVNLTMPGA